MKNAKRNMFYETMFRRNNLIKKTILGFFMMIASWPRLFIEVFIRRSFGARYFSLASTITIVVILGIVPVMFDHIVYYQIDHDGNSSSRISLYIYLAVFLFMSLRHNDEIKREPGVFDMARFSLSTGLIHPKFYEIKLLGKKANTRSISIFYEPLLFLAAGILLMLMQQTLGYILIFCSVVYSLSYAAAYHLGDEYVMDIIDEMICTEELANNFIDNKGPEQTRGFNVTADRPESESFRRAVADNFFKNEPAEEVY